MSDDDDWFESAFEDDESDDSGAPADSERPGVENGDAEGEGDTDSPFADEGDAESAFEEGDADPFGTDAEESLGGDDAGPFGDGADAESPFEDESGGEQLGGDDADPFSDDAAAESPFEEDDDGGSLFDDDFASAMSSAGPGGGGGGDDFDDEDFESDIPRIDLGIDGLDEMIQGGIPERHLMVSIGSPGTGKTTFGLQFLYHGLKQGDNAVFITLEQSHDAIMNTANERGWNFDHYEEEDMLAVVDLDPVEMANSLDNIRGELPQLIRDFDAERIVLDSVSLLEMMYDDQAKRRTEVFDFTRSLKDAGVTTMLTSEAAENNPYASRHGIIEYLTDAVFVLQYVRGDTQETRLAIEIQKIRNANHSRETKPYEITLDGIDVYQQASIF
jgi:KaiC domain protein